MATADFLRPDARPAPDASIAPGDAQALEAFLGRAARRRNALTIGRHVVRALLPAAIGGALGVLAYRFYLVDGPAWLPPALLGASALVGAFMGWRRRVGAFVAAREADKYFGLHDLLSSAHAFARPAKSNISATPFVPPLVTQAAAKTRDLNINELYRFRFDRPAQVLGVSLLALVGASLANDNPYFLSPEQKKLNAALKTEGEKMKKAAETAKKDKKLSQNARAQIAARRMEALAARMQAGRMTKKQALLSLDQLKRDMAGVSKPNESQPTPGDAQKLRDALASGSYQTDEAKRMQAELKQNRDGEAGAKLEELARKIEKNSFGSQQERDKAANDLEEAARALRRGGAQNEDAAKQLEDAAKALRQNQNPNQQQQQNQNGQQQQQGGQQQQNGQQQGQQGQQQGQQGQQQQSGQQGQQQQGGQQGQQSGSGAPDQLRKMAENLKSGQGGGNSVQEMMKRIEEAESSAGGSNSGQSGQSGQSQQGQQGEGQGQSGQSGQGQNGQSGQGQQGQGGQSGNGKSGNGKSGQGQNPGSTPGSGAGNGGGDSRQVVTPGKDLQPSNPMSGTGGGAGLGPRGRIKGAQGGGGGVSKQRAGQSNDGRLWEGSWSDKLPGTQKNISRIKGKMDQNGESERLETRGEARGGTARTPYYEAYPSYKREAEDAIARENVPPAYRDSVKQYFDRIDPNNR